MAKGDIVRALLVTAELFNREFSEAAAHLLVEDLSVYPEKDVLAALTRCRRELRYFPTPAEIISRIPGQSVDPKSEAQLITGKIIKCITYFGPYKAREARAEVGEVGWEAIQQIGGFDLLCQMQDREFPATRAQLAKLIEALLMRGPMPQRTQIEQKEHRGGELLQIGNLVKQIKGEDR
jgi:hypothetical protein